MSAMIRIGDNTAEILEPEGWRPLNALEWIELPGGNSLQINGESYWSGAIQGFAIGILTCLGAIGVVAAVVVGSGR